MIVYTVICRARDAAILVEQSTEALTGNAPQVTTALLEHLRDHPAAMNEGDLKTYVHRNEKDGGGDDIFSQFFQACTMNITTADDLDPGDIQEHYFHLWFHEGVFYCCLSDDADMKQQKVNFAFLKNVAIDFTGTFTARKIKNCNAYAMDKQFAPNLRSAMHYYNTNHKKLSRDDKINSLLAQVEDMKTVLGRNINLLLDREHKINTLLETSEEAKRNSMVFKRKSMRLKREQRNRSFKLWCTIAGVVVLILYVIMASFCGATLQQCGGGERRLRGISFP